MKFILIICSAAMYDFEPENLVLNRLLSSPRFLEFCRRWREPVAKARHGQGAEVEVEEGTGPEGKLLEVLAKFVLVMPQIRAANFREINEIFTQIYRKYT
jgi:hypothetical protein